MRSMAPSARASATMSRTCAQVARRAACRWTPASSFRRSLVVQANFGQPGASGLNPELRETIDKVISSNKIVVFMKGTPQFPQCGFSNTVCQIIRAMNVPFEGVNILADDRLRSGMKEYSQWPTFPQVYIGGEFVGGADIMIQMYQSGELAELLEREMMS